MKPVILTTAEILDLLSPLKELDKGLDKILAEYQKEERRAQAKELKEYCQPGSILRSITHYDWIRHLPPEDIEKTMREMTLNNEILNCETANHLIEYWAKDPRPGILRMTCHPWLKAGTVFSRYPNTLAYCYEKVLSAYFQCMGIKDRWSVYDFYIKSIVHKKFLFRSTKERWEEIERKYFYSLSHRREFLDNMFLAIDQHEGLLTDRGEETEDFESEAISENTGLYGFVYFIRNGDLCKIGITENLLRRMDQLKPDEVLNVVRCKNFKELEKDLHSLFKEVRLPQTEYFRLSEEQVSKVHKLMTSLADF